MIQLYIINYFLKGNSLIIQNNNQLIDNLQEQSADPNNSLLSILNKKKQELTAYKELTLCARKTLEKYYEHQRIQDAAGFYDDKQHNSNELSFNSGDFSQHNQQPSDVSSELANLNKMKKVCQKCLTWQYAKHQLESPSTRDDEETNELIMDLFLLNDQFISAKYLIKKLKLSKKLQFKLDFGHLKHRLLNLNVSSSIIVIDLDAILSECIAFTQENSEQAPEYDYKFEICFKLLNELKTLNELNNQVLVSLSEYLLSNYKHLLSPTQTDELKIVQLTAKIFQILVHELSNEFESYKRHYASPLLIIEQLLMNSHIDLCSKTIKMCHDLLSGSSSDTLLHANINKTLTKYARKALEFKVYKGNANTNELSLSNKFDSLSRKSPQNMSTLGLNSKKSIFSFNCPFNIHLIQILKKSSLQ